MYSCKTNRSHNAPPEKTEPALLNAQPINVVVLHRAEYTCFRCKGTKYLCGSCLGDPVLCKCRAPINVIVCPACGGTGK